ncbi:MAG: hypothetical protein H7329_03730 [Opitutaceae bacterium]|nr:hypothetical protein [Cytophagales bacterium]
MKTLKFNTDIKCAGCVAGVSPFLNGDKNIKKWDVDISDPQKVLTVESDLEENQVVELVSKAGFKAKSID